jgi:hypothetical protein
LKRTVQCRSVLEREREREAARARFENILSRKLFFRVLKLIRFSRSVGGNTQGINFTENVVPFFQKKKEQHKVLRNNIPALKPTRSRNTMMHIKNVLCFICALLIAATSALCALAKPIDNLYPPYESDAAEAVFNATKSYRWTNSSANLQVPSGQFPSTTVNITMRSDGSPFREGDEFVTYVAGFSSGYAFLIKSCDRNTGMIYIQLHILHYCKLLYISTICFWKASRACGRLSLKVGVIKPFSTENNSPCK